MNDIYGVFEGNFYTDEYALHNYVYFTSTLEKAQAFVLKKFGVEDAPLGEQIDLGDDEDEYGECFILIEKIKVN